VPNNIFISSEGGLVVGDLGSARRATLASPVDSKFTLQVISRTYRPIEMFLGLQNYSYAVDMVDLPSSLCLTR
jgi:serine/threonine protein kinase